MLDLSQVGSKGRTCKEVLLEACRTGDAELFYNSEFTSPLMKPTNSIIGDPLSNQLQTAKTNYTVLKAISTHPGSPDGVALSSKELETVEDLKDYIESRIDDDYKISTFS